MDGDHAEIYDGKPGCATIGFVVTTSAGTVYHPGDAWNVPEAGVDIMLTPTSGPWLQLAEAIDVVPAVDPSRAHPIHDGRHPDVGHPDPGR